jgi:hypothetical protein
MGISCCCVTGVAVFHPGFLVKCAGVVWERSGGGGGLVFSTSLIVTFVTVNVRTNRHVDHHLHW